MLKISETSKPFAVYNHGHLRGLIRNIISLTSRTSQYCDDASEDDIDVIGDSLILMSIL